MCVCHCGFSSRVLSGWPCHWCGESRSVGNLGSNDHWVTLGVYMPACSRKNWTTLVRHRDLILPDLTFLEWVFEAQHSSKDGSQIGCLGHVSAGLSFRKWGGMPFAAPLPLGPGDTLLLPGYPFSISAPNVKERRFPIKTFMFGLNSHLIYRKLCRVAIFSYSFFFFFPFYSILYPGRYTSDQRKPWKFLPKLGKRWTGSQWKRFSWF